MHLMFRAHLACCLLLAASAALAQPAVYRCGSTYSQAPCPGGRAVNTEDMRTPEQVQQAREGAQRDADKGDALARERQQAQARSAPGAAAGIRHAGEPAVGVSAPKGRTGKQPPKPKTVKLKKAVKKMLLRQQ